MTAQDTVDDTEGNNRIVLSQAGGLAADTPFGVGGNGTVLQVNLDNGETLSLNNALFGMNATLQFAGGEEIDLESWVGDKLDTPLTLGLGNGGGRLYGGKGKRHVLSTRPRRAQSSGGGYNFCGMAGGRLAA